MTLTERLRALGKRREAEGNYTDQNICEAAIEKIEDESQMLQLIDERDAAEECLSQMYYLVTGNGPEWSNKFGHQQALEEVGDAIAALKTAAKLATS